jgi:hypothetical protein
MTDTDFIGYARECTRLAWLTNDQDLREQLFQMARNWMAEAISEARESISAQLSDIHYTVIDTRTVIGESRDLMRRVDTLLER